MNDTPLDALEETMRDMLECGVISQEEYDEFIFTRQEENT